MALPARPQLPRCDPHSTFCTSEIFIAAIAADEDEDEDEDGSPENSVTCCAWQRRVSQQRIF